MRGHALFGTEHIGAVHIGLGKALADTVARWEEGVEPEVLSRTTSRGGVRTASARVPMLRRATQAWHLSREDAATRLQYPTSLRACAQEEVIT